MAIKRSINYIGWLGHKNLGDEALYKIIQDIFNSFRLVPAEMDGADNNLFSPVTIIGGSTGIPEWFERLRPTKFNYVFGAGVKDPAFLGYNYIFREDMKVKVMFEKLKIFRYVGVRGNISKALLLRHGINSEVIGDPCLSLRSTILNKKDEAKIAISIGSDGILHGMDERRLFLEVAKVCRSLKNEGYEPILIPFWEKNVEAVRNLATRERIDFFEDWFNIESTLNLINSCKILIGQKLHSLVFAAATGTPFISLEYQPKCYDFVESVGFQDYTIKTDIVSEEKILNLFIAIIENYGEMQKKLAKNVESYREKQRNFAQNIIRDIESLPEQLWRTPSSLERLRNTIFWKADVTLRRRTKLWYAWNRLFLRLVLRHMN
jgi:hypothetical protein